MNKELENLLIGLENFGKDHIELTQEMLKADNGNIYGVDLLAVAVFKRSYSLITGFCKMIEEDNFICAAPLIRVQLDNLLRFSAVHLVKEPHQLAFDIILGKQLNKIKDKNGKLMQDYYLVSQLKEKYDWIERLYKETSGYIHLSEKHFFNTIHNLDDSVDKRIVTISVNDKSENIDIKFKIEAVEAMHTITNEILNYLYGWIFTKQSKSEDRNN